MLVDPELRQAIELHPSDDVARVARDLSLRLGRNIPITVVVRVRGSIQRNVDVNRAREHAALDLDRKIDRIESASGVLEQIFHNDTLPLKDRIEASKELRQWTKLGMDAAGIHDTESDTVFMIGGEWALTPPDA